MNANRLIAAGIGFVALIYILSSSIFVVDQRKFAVVLRLDQSSGRLKTLAFN